MCITWFFTTFWCRAHSKCPRLPLPGRRGPRTRALTLDRRSETDWIKVFALVLTVWRTYTCENHGKQFGVNFELLLWLSNSLRSCYVPSVIDVIFFRKKRRYFFIILLSVLIHVLDIWLEKYTFKYTLKW